MKSFLGKKLILTEAGKVLISFSFRCHLPDVVYYYNMLEKARKLTAKQIFSLNEPCKLI